MLIKQDRCIGCGQCVVICPVQAIKLNEDNKAFIDQDICVECSTCYRSANCPSKAIRKERLKMPRLVRNPFSDVVATHKLTGVPGRGTEEMKTNDVTRRIDNGEIGKKDSGGSDSSPGFESVLLIVVLVLFIYFRRRKNE